MMAGIVFFWGHSFKVEQAPARTNMTAMVDMMPLRDRANERIIHITVDIGRLRASVGRRLTPDRAIAIVAPVRIPGPTAIAIDMEVCGELGIRMHRQRWTVAAEQVSIVWHGGNG
jgi:hypothetical protein